MKRTENDSLKWRNFPFAGNDRGGVFLVPMHGGIWTLCINLRDDEIRELGKKGFPAVSQCFNYLAGNMDNSRSGGSDEPRADWQHSESQTPIHPHLSRYNNNVSNAIQLIPDLTKTCEFVRWEFFLFFLLRFAPTKTGKLSFTYTKLSNYIFERLLI